MSTKSEGLQNCLDKFADYCSKWGLSMNYKTIFTLRTLHEYIDLIILKNLPLIPFFRSLYNNAEWMTESNAFLRSTKQAYIFPDFGTYPKIWGEGYLITIFFFLKWVSIRSK
jgi:hypothetical protein